MHGNTEKTEDGTKTRRFDKILAELTAAFEVHEQMGSHLGGVHFEMTARTSLNALVEPAASLKRISPRHTARRSTHASTTNKL